MNKRYWLIVPIILSFIFIYMIICNLDFVLLELCKILNSKSILYFAITIVIGTCVIDYVLIALKCDSFKGKSWKVFDYLTYYVMVYTFYNIIAGLLNQITTGKQFFVNGTGQFDFWVFLIFSICGFFKPIPCLYNVWKEVLEYMMAQEVQVSN